MYYTADEYNKGDFEIMSGKSIFNKAIDRLRDVFRGNEYLDDSDEDIVLSTMPVKYEPVIKPAAPLPSIPKKIESYFIADKDIAHYKIHNTRFGPEYRGHDHHYAKKVWIEKFTGRVDLSSLVKCDEDIFLAKSSYFSASGLTTARDIIIPMAKEAMLNSLRSADIYAIRADKIRVGFGFKGKIYCNENTVIEHTSGPVNYEVIRVWNQVAAMYKSLLYYLPRDMHPKYQKNL